MKKILLAGQNKYWCKTLEQATEFWLKLGINHVMIKLATDTKYIESGKVVEREFEKYQKLQEKYGVRYHFHPYALRMDRELIDSSIKARHPLLKNILTELDEQIYQYGLYPLITVHLPVFEKPDYNLKVDKQVALQNGKSFFQSLNLKSHVALEVMHGPFRNKNENGTALLGYKAEHFREIIGDKNYGLCIDIGHLNLADEPLEKFLELPYPIFSVHLHGNDGTKDEHKIAIENNVKNFELVKKLLRKVQGPVVLELFNHGYSINDVRRFLELWELKEQ